MRAQSFFSSSIIFILTFWTIIGCQNASNKELVSHKDNIFPTNENAQDITKDFPCIAESWQIIGDNIITTNATPDSVFSILSCEDLTVKEVFGKKGHSGNEFIAPLVFCGKEKEILIIDNIDKKIYNYSNGVTSQIGTSTIKDALNELRSISYPIVAYSVITPQKQNLKIVNIATGKDVDSVVFKDKEQKEKASLFDFAWNYNNGKIVIALMHSDLFMVCDINHSGELTQIHKYQTDGVFSDNKIYYSDVACGKEIYLLSQKNVDLTNLSGHSSVEIYDYSGKAIKNIDLDFIADKMLLDCSGKKLLFTSTNDEYLHLITIHHS